MKIDITLKNYRCFDDQQPAKFTIGTGFTSFVGPNNSGKSSILKVFFELKHFFATSFQFSHSPIQMPEHLGNAQIQAVRDQDEILTNLNDRPMTMEIEFVDFPERFGNGDKLVLNKVLYKKYRNDSRFEVSFGTKKKMLSFNPQFPYVMDAYDLISSSEGRFNYSLLKEGLEKLSNNMFIGSFRNAISEAQGQYFGINIGTAFVSTWSAWKTGDNKRQNDFIQSVTEDIRRIFRFKKLEIGTSDDRKSLKIFINNKSYNIMELGGGLAQFIIVLGNVAISNPSFIFIDEPELGLHPSLQLDFLTSLASYTKEGIVFATHSIGLARSSSERIYTVRQIEEKSFVKPFEQIGNLVEFLGEMSFSAYQEIGFKKILLVEGITEIKTFQQFLRLFHKDHDVVFIPLGGSQFKNWKIEFELGELKRISDQIAVIIDSEKQSIDEPLKPEIQQFLDICKKLDFKILVTDLRATENYFTQTSIRAEKNSDKYSSLKPYEKFEESKHGWAKEDNWRIAMTCPPKTSPPEWV